MSPLDRKLLRDIVHLKGQVITIALVVGAGIACYVTMDGTYVALLQSRESYYERDRFGDAFAHCKRAPESVVARIGAIPGVASVYSRETELVSLPLSDEPEPALGQIVSLPSSGEQPPLNGISLQSGRWPEPGRAEEVLVLDGFAVARGIGPGDRITAILNGTARDLRVVGTALSPEYVFAMAPGSTMPEPDRFAVIWMFRDAVAPSFQMEGAFNDLVLRLQPGASERSVLDAIDRVLEPYGGLGAFGRDRQESHFFITQELMQLETMATILPFIFLSVAAFLLNVVLSRLVHLQRPEIAALKAVGYADLAIGMHFLKLVSLVVLIGAVIGAAAGYWLGIQMTELYTEYFHFPVLQYELDVRVIVIGVAISQAAAVIGALVSVRQIVRLPPAEAMRPPSPPSYARSWVEKIGIFALFGQAGRMVFREITRRPLRTALSSLGIAMAVAILVAGRFGTDSFEMLMDQVFQTAMTEDLSGTLLRPAPASTVRELEHLPGVHLAEGMRITPVRFHHGSRWRDSIIFGVPDRMQLRRLMDSEGRDVALPEDGIVLTTTLADILRLHVGDRVEVELREGQRGRRDVVVAGLIDEMYGLQGHMRIEPLRRLLREESSVSYVLLDVDPAQMDEVRSRLREMPSVGGVTRRMALIENFREQTGRQWLTTTLILTLFAATIAIGIVYNNARVALSMRARDLASLRVLGFTRREISSVLLGELAVQVLLAIPLGLWLGTEMAEWIMSSMVDPERYRMPAMVSGQTYAFATVVTLASGVISGLLVRRRLDKLDLIAVLKTRE
ncbi:MAG: ABC transporter permease [Sandaracinaceae bacterium]|nr:ABC transporter permease [Sandaracinaceae bacterium]